MRQLVEIASEGEREKERENRREVWLTDQLVKPVYALRFVEFASDLKFSPTTKSASPSNLGGRQISTFTHEKPCLPGRDCFPTNLKGRQISEKKKKKEGKNG